ncbi:hypothetical protein FNV43_RR01564 [Rhamnella rubrinervis]|uniref:Uncharacterized protein n=1 Tax=Rhamnella rubrinervis TaxID=2594499 RepID=A0A8K0HQP8_9ROSA|nr:hypothetical protein FNV43_RR01564 [Rhamnella rubrinervis]
MVWAYWASGKKPMDECNQTWSIDMLPSSHPQSHRHRSRSSIQDSKGFWGLLRIFGFWEVFLTYNFLGIMSSIGTSKGILEIAKFGLYVAIPIVLMYGFANNTKNIQKFMGNRSYVVYPPEGPRPPSPEELREMARELARKKNIR